MDRIHAFAKINVFLNIVGRKDGFHQLESLFQVVSLADEITFEEAAEPEFLCDKIDLTQDNLIVKAYEFLRGQFPKIPSLRIQLTKKVPIAAGLGGGSSDAAATLNYLNQKYQLEMSVPQLKECAAKLGSDVPFFIEGGTQWVTGRGEFCESVQALPQAWILLANPGIACSTAEVFKNYAKEQKEFSKKADPAFLKKPYSWETLKPFLKNDLLESAIHVAPPIQNLLQQLQKTQAFYAGLSGSGATCFGIYLSEADARSAYNQIDAEFKFIATPRAGL